MYKLFGFEENFKYIRYVECIELLNSMKNYVRYMYRLSIFEEKFKYFGYVNYKNFSNST